MKLHVRILLPGLLAMLPAVSMAATGHPMIPQATAPGSNPARAPQAPVPVPRRAPPPNPARQLPQHPLPASTPAGFTVAAVGDLIIAHPAADGDNPRFAKVRKVLQSANVTFGNFEGTLIDPATSDAWVAPETGGGDEYGPPQLAGDLAKMGFDLLSHANNHTTDWGLRGMESTDRYLDKAGLVHAGTGKDLAEARAPRYLTIPQGRVALVAMTSSYTSMEPAGRPMRGVAGRPGVNVLHTRLCHVVTAQQMRWLEQIYDTQPHRPRHPASAQRTRLHLFSDHYCAGLADGLRYIMNPYDLDGVLRAVREGKEESNFEIVYVHAHNPGNWSSKPADFLPKLARDAIDAGADEVVASGPHRLRGIEIYKGKPIFYSLGNFFYEVAHRTYLDPDNVQRAHLDMSTTTNYEYQQQRVGDAPAYQYQSVIAVSTFGSSGAVSKVTLYPVTIGYRRRPRADAGVPYLAKPKMARHILERLQRLSQPFGTRLAIHGDVGIITVAGAKQR